MATMQYASFGANNECRILIDYNANNGRVQGLVCENMTQFGTYAAVKNPNTGEWYERTFPPNATTQQAVPAGAMTVRVATDAETGNQYLEVRTDATNTWGGLETMMRHPA
jgi:hypothetical protein